MSRHCGKAVPEEKEQEQEFFVLSVAARLENPSDCVMRTRLSDDASSHTDDSGCVCV